VGAIYGSGSVSNCSSNAGVSGSEGVVGGLAGSNGGAISNCYATGIVSAASTYVGSVGGLAGSNGDGGTITHCYSTASVSASGSNIASTGGLVGSNSGQISNSYATGSVSGVDRVGGLVGGGGIIRNCYATGSVSGNSSVGGLVGSGATVYSSFWDIQTSGQTTSAGGTGLLTADMQMASTFINAGWDFVGETINGSEYIWRLCVDGTSYPQLDWQFLLGDLDCPDGVDVYDLAVLCEQWLQIGAYSADIAPLPARDGIVNFLDFAVLARGWLAGVPN